MVISDLHSKFALGRDTSNLRPLRLGEEKRKKKQDQDIMSASATQGDHKESRAAKYWAAITTQFE